MTAAELVGRRAGPRPRTSISRAQIETITARALGLFGVVFGAQTVPMALNQSAALKEGWGPALMAAVYAGIVLLALSSILKRAVRAVCYGFAVLFAASVLAWPLLVADVSLTAGRAPWLYFLCTVATTAAGFAMPLWVACGYTVAVPVAYGVIRTLPAGGDASALLASLDALYAVILGLVVIIIITMLRQASAAVDTAQEAALRRYDVAVRQHASEVERVRVDALVHDSVLTTLLSAAAATSPDERALAVRMAEDAIGRLNEAGEIVPDSIALLPLNQLVRRLTTAMTTFATPFALDAANLDDVELPEDAAEAVYSATVQAMLNSVQHADDEDGSAIERTLLVRGVGPVGCLVEITDTGRGFDPSTIPSGRLGIRMSIQERVAGAGGTALVRSEPGKGTTVSIRWPAEGDAG
jgi:signal transduction histidine kinase